MRDAQRIVAALQQIATLLTLSGESPFKVQAYERGAEIVRALGPALGPLLEQHRLAEIEGIGPSLSKQITELWEHGGSELLARLMAQHPPGAVVLATIPGLTARRIRVLHDELAITSLAELRDACVRQRVRRLPGFGPKTEQKLLSALEEREAPARHEPMRRVLLIEALILARHWEEQLTRAGARRAICTGALRRREETIADIELLLEVDGAHWLERVSRMSSVVRMDAERGRAELVEGVGLRLHVATNEDWGTALVITTGSEAHVSFLQERAAQRGLRLEPGGLYDGHGQRLPASADEAAVYRALDLSFIPPELRHERARTPVPADDLENLLEESHVRGLVHCHTTYSDGKASIEQMARTAEAMGMQYITITDHSPSAHYAGGVKLDALERQWDEISEVQERVSIRILRGTESDILADGSLDYPDAILEQLDIVIASVHSRFRMSRAQTTERLVRAMRLPLFKIWGHALGRLLLQREPLECDVEAVLDALSLSGGAIEINGDPKRLDLAPQWIPHARERQIPFVVSVDAHSTQALSVLPFGVMMARRGGLTRHEVLNTLSAPAFAARVRPVPS